MSRRVAMGSRSRSASSCPVGHSEPDGASTWRRIRGETFRSQGVNIRTWPQERTFPPAEGAGVIVFIAADERQLRELLIRADSELFRAGSGQALPLDRRKLRWRLDAAEALGGTPAARAR